MTDRSLDGFAQRARLLDQPRPLQDIQITSLRQVTYEHQRAAMAAGYSSMAELAIDQLLAEVVALRDRVATLENDAAGGHVVQHGD